ncbi:MAG: lytic transglycosylase domain-containing protein [Candidatus Goldbacteria bacterium]|nr:lytic transglycosylase domain-containing protein [Candidatus Goldiibacteriota bacterium]
MKKILKTITRVAEHLFSGTFFIPSKTLHKLATLVFFILLILFDIQFLESDVKNDFLKILKTIDNDKRIEILNNFEITDKTILAIIKVESNFDKNCVSYKGAIGLMNIMPLTGRGYGYNKKELFEIEKNITCGITHLIWLSERYPEKKEILQRYFWGNKKQLHEKYYKSIIELENQIKKEGGEKR